MKKVTMKSITDDKGLIQCALCIRDEIVKIKAIAAHKHYSSLNIDYRVLTLINDEFVEMKFL